MTTKDPLKRIEQTKRYRTRHRLKLRKDSRDRIRRLRVIALDMLGGKCVSCGINDRRVLQIDHINGGGTKENERLSSHGIHRKIALGKIEGYQLLCANCNWIKKHEKQENHALADQVQ